MMSSVELTNKSGKTMVVSIEGDHSVSEDTKHQKIRINDGESAVVFAERTQSIAVDFI